MQSERKNLEVPFRRKKVKMEGRGLQMWHGPIQIGFGGCMTRKVKVNGSESEQLSHSPSFIQKYLS